MEIVFDPPIVQKMAISGMLAKSLMIVMLFVSDAGAVVPMALKSRRRATSEIQKRQFTEPIQNYLPGVEYYAAVQVGTPPQDLELIVDTGSSDIWMFAPNVCQSTTQKPCIGGTFDTSSSKTYTLLSTDTFNIMYADGSGVSGDYIQDTFSLNGKTVTGQAMALATKDSTNTAGIMGIALDGRESIVSNGGTSYSNLPDSMVAQGLIKSKAYSLYLDDQASATGSLIFGGYDTDKFYGDLTILPLLEDQQSGVVDGFDVAWTSLTITTSEGSQAILAPDSIPAIATLDSGTTLLYLPTPVANAVSQIFGASLTDPITCSLMTQTGSLDFGFGGTGGPTIAVPFSELARPIYDGQGNWVTDSKGNKVCQFGIQDSGVSSNTLLFGQTFLRSAYVLYDLDNLLVAIAQSKYGVTTSNIVEYNGNSTNQDIQTFSGAASATVPMASSGMMATSAFLATSSGIFQQTGFLFGTSMLLSSAIMPQSSVSVPSGASTIVNGVVALSTSISVSQPASASGAFPLTATLQSADASGSIANSVGSSTSQSAAVGLRSVAENGNHFAFACAAMIAFFGCGMLLL